MIFLSEGTRYVWDGQKNKMLCEFKRGQFETEDKYIIQRLIELGYQTENGLEVVIDDAPEEIIDEELETLRQMAKEEGVERYWLKNAETLKKELGVV